MADTNILLQGLVTGWRQLRKDWRQTRREYSQDAVHDLRVASRRLIAVLDTLGSLVDDPEIQECRRRVKKSLGALSPLRDAQVQSAYISKMERRYPQLKDFQKILNDKEARIARKVQKLLKKGPKLGRAIAKAKRHAEDHTDNKAILGILDRRYLEVIRLAKKVDRTDAATIHQMRLAFKCFRYTAEVAQPLIRRKVTKARLKQFHAFQTMMGDIQDVEVLSSRVAKWAEQEKKRIERLKPVLLALERQKEKDVDAFMDSAHQVYSFWNV